MEAEGAATASHSNVPARFHPLPLLLPTAEPANSSAEQSGLGSTPEDDSAAAENAARSPLEESVRTTATERKGHRATSFSPVYDICDTRFPSVSPKSQIAAQPLKSALRKPTQSNYVADNNTEPNTNSSNSSTSSPLENPNGTVSPTPAVATFIARSDVMRKVPPIDVESVTATRRDSIATASSLSRRTGVPRLPVAQFRTNSSRFDTSGPLTSVRRGAETSRRARGGADGPVPDYFIQFIEYLINVAPTPLMGRAADFCLQLLLERTDLSIGTRPATMALADITKQKALKSVCGALRISEQVVQAWKTSGHAVDVKDRCVLVASGAVVDALGAQPDCRLSVLFSEADAVAVIDPFRRAVVSLAPGNEIPFWSRFADQNLLSDSLRLAVDRRLRSHYLPAHYRYSCEAGTPTASGSSGFFSTTAVPAVAGEVMILRVRDRLLSPEQSQSSQGSIENGPASARQMQSPRDTNVLQVTVAAEEADLPNFKCVNWHAVWELELPPQNKSRDAMFETALEGLIESNTMAIEDGSASMRQRKRLSLKIDVPFHKGPDQVAKLLFDTIERQEAEVQKGLASLHVAIPLNVCVTETKWLRSLRRLVPPAGREFDWAAAGLRLEEELRMAANS